MAKPLAKDTTASNHRMESSNSSTASTALRVAMARRMASHLRTTGNRLLILDNRLRLTESLSKTAARHTPTTDRTISRTNSTHPTKLDRRTRRSNMVVLHPMADNNSTHRLEDSKPTVPATLPTTLFRPQG